MQVGLQLYTIGSMMGKDMDSALRAVSDAGYEYVEFAGFFGKTASEINMLLKKYGLKAISVHQPYKEIMTNEGGIADMLVEVGVKYCAMPYMSVEKHKGAADYEQTIAEFKSASEKLNEMGIKMLYHNHEFEFAKYEGKYLNDWLIESVGTDNIYPEIDVCWVRYAGVDPAKYILKYTGHIPVLHVKDFTGNADTSKTLVENNFRMQPVGSGCLEWNNIIAAAKEAGTEYLIVEQDFHYDTDPIENIKKSRDFLKRLGY